jgi:hypothetical protein
MRSFHVVGMSLAFRVTSGLDCIAWKSLGTVVLMCWVGSALAAGTTPQNSVLPQASTLPPGQGIIFGSIEVRW